MQRRYTQYGYTNNNVSNTYENLSNNQYQKQPQKTNTDVGVGTNQQTLKRCGIVKDGKGSDSYCKTCV